MGLLGGSAHYIVYRVITFEPESKSQNKETELPSYRCYGITRRKHRIIEGLSFALLIVFYFIGLLASFVFFGCTTQHTGS